MSFPIVIAHVIQFLFQKLLIPLTKISLITIILIIILTFCGSIAGLGGTLLFYIIIFFYIKALLSYRPPESMPLQNNFESQNNPQSQPQY